MSIHINSQEPLVSVIIPTYNRQHYLKQAIESAIGQKYQNIEIIVSDDCSPQSPQKLIDSFGDSRIRFYRNPKNLGICLNVINGFKQARGKYVASLNDDDMWNEDFLTTLVPTLEANPDLALAFSDYYIMDSEGKINEQATEEDTLRWKRDRLKEGIYQPFVEAGLVDQSVFLAVATVMRTDVIDWDNIPPEAGPFWDLYLTYLACRSGRGAYYHPGKLTRYRVHAQSEMESSGKANVRAKIRSGKAGIFCYGRFMEDEKLQEFRPYFERKWAEANTTVGIGLMRSQQLAEARPYFWQALKQQKSDVRSIAALMLSFTPPSLASRF